MVTPLMPKNLTKDTVPVDVDAVFVSGWCGTQKKAALGVEVQAAIAWAAQTALREVIEQMTQILVRRGKNGRRFTENHRRTDDSQGVTVQSVEIGT